MLIPNDAAASLICLDEGPRDAPAVVYLPEILESPKRFATLALASRSPLRHVALTLPGAGDSEPLGAGEHFGHAVTRAAQALSGAGLRDTLLVGCGVGGLLAQGLAAEHPALVRALALTNTGGKLDAPDTWQQRALAAGSPSWLDTERRRLGEVCDNAFSPIAYQRLALAIAETDLRASTARLRLPVLGLAGARDRVTPPDLLRELIDTIPGAQFQVLRGAGHLPLLDAQDRFSHALNTFIADTGHDLELE
ncbi:alpha/beta fold hydrolase [Pontivivens insulae]|uniref:3-oxoadipate enol-lactonase 2 n=1 Tax=Pontivivens insulae TaxID=1639689 RepID=A0A2R8ADA7_9RHOB|nr:alpha/beta fold hydrolase [Pontivivens insulae]RED14157.1 3-oxoadipate enol-lactonase [Pontivivens insulae]SPF30233.1 3-oxoadipate enol-lactonase 2 [Pontivivens insulae]